MNRVRVWLSALALLAVAAFPVSAQVQTGSILVRVTDAQGGAVPGVSVTVSSPVLVSGTMTGVTDSGGVNRFPSLQRASIRKLELQAPHRCPENVHVVVGATCPRHAAKSLRAETVTVTGHRRLRTDTAIPRQPQRTNAAGYPGGSRIWSLVEYKVPSL